jgi:hypothetical protein
MHLMNPQSLAAFGLKLLGEVHCDLADVPKAQALVAMLERIESGEFIIVTPAPVGQRSGAAPPTGALHV